MEKIVEYKTLGGTDATKLDEAVNEAIKNGFQPYGNPYVHMPSICQAVVKFEQPKN